MNLENIDIVMLIAFAGALFQFGLGYWQKKVNNPDMKFQPIYISIAIVGAVTASVALQGIEVPTINISMIFGAILMGMGGTAGVEKLGRELNVLK